MGVIPRAKKVSGYEEEIRSLMALSPGRKAITHSNENTSFGNGLMKETSNYSTYKTTCEKVVNGFLFQKPRTEARIKPV